MGHYVELGINKKYVLVRTAVQCVESFELQTPHTIKHDLFSYATAGIIHLHIYIGGVRNTEHGVVFAIDLGFWVARSHAESMHLLPRALPLLVLHSYVVLRVYINLHFRRDKIIAVS